MMRKNPFNSIAERELFFVKTGRADKVKVIVRIGAPYWSEEGDFAACPVEFENYLGRTSDIQGTDLFDALETALWFTDLILTADERIGTFYWPDGEIFEPLKNLRDKYKETNKDYILKFTK